MRHRLRRWAAPVIERLSLARWRLCSGHSGVDCYYLGHHKCASNWMRAFVRQVCQVVGYNYDVIGGDRSNAISSRWRKHTFRLYVNSTPEDVATVPADARGFHLIRDPRDVLISDYFSRKNSHRVDTPEKAEL